MSDARSKILPMCLPGDTSLPVIDGRQYRLEDVAVDARPVIYACSPTGRVITAYCSVTTSAHDALTLTSVQLDDCSMFRCANTEEVLKRDGSYDRSSELHAGSSLMPLYLKRDKDGYVLVQQNYSGRFQKVHWVVARSGLLGKIPRFDRQRTIIHHRNFDEADNSPENLEFMGSDDHSAFHRSLVERNEHWQSPEFESRRVEALRRKARTAEGHAYFAERGTKNILRYMEERRSHFRESVAGNGQRGATYLQQYNRSDKGKAKSRELSNRYYECEACGERVRSYIGLHNHRRWRHGYNHSVVSLASRLCEQRLYCVSVMGAENFAISAGVFLRACG